MSEWEVVKVGLGGSCVWTIMRDQHETGRVGTVCGKRTGAELFEDEAIATAAFLNMMDKFDGKCTVFYLPDE